MGILRTTPHGYRTGDARFLIGAIYWKQGKPANALESWREITFDSTDSYATAYSDILMAIRTPDGANVNAKQVDRDRKARINRILNIEYGRWIAFSFDRLRQFGYRFNTF